jgi:hypothetical protein
VRLVPADVDVRAGGERCDLADDLVDEPVDRLLADAERAEPDLDAAVQVGRDAVARQLGIRRERCVRVPGHLDLGDDGDEPVLRVPDDLPVLALRVPAAGPASDLRRPAMARQAWPGPDCDAPALVVGQVEMQAVELVEGHEVDEPLHLARPVEVPRDVEHQATPSEAGPVVDHAQRDTPRPRAPTVGLDRGWEELAQCLRSPEEPGGACSGERDARVRDDQPVALGAEAAIPGDEGERDAALRRLVADRRDG